MKHEKIVEVLDFLNSIEGAGYGGMASFEIAREHVRHAYRISLRNISHPIKDSEGLPNGMVCCGKPSHVGNPTDGYTVECCERFVPNGDAASAGADTVREALQAVWDDWAMAHDCSGAEEYEVKDVAPETIVLVEAALASQSVGEARELTESEARLVNRALIDSGTPLQPDAGRGATIRECMKVIDDLRASGAGLFDAKHSGQRGEDRSTALYDVYQKLRALSHTRGEG